MDFLPHSNLTQFLAFCAGIKQEIRAWKLVNVSLSKGTGSIFYIAKKMRETLSDMSGEIFICNSHELLCLVKAGENADLAALQKRIQSGFSEYECHVEVVDTTREGLQKIELRLKQECTAETSGPAGESLLLKERQRREENIILVADDDMFMRSLVKKGVEGYGAAHECETGETVVDRYLQTLPDVVFLDIHMPGKSGIDILEEILMFDQHAFIVMLSADSGKENVLETKKIGAKGFIAKPFTKEKLIDMLQKCPTVRMK